MNTPNDVADPLKIAENYVASYFSIYQLLQCKMWLDTLPHEGTPKLISLLTWVSALPGAALQGKLDFPKPPVTFLEVAHECLPQL